MKRRIFYLTCFTLFISMAFNIAKAQIDSNDCTITIFKKDNCGLYLDNSTACEYIANIFGKGYLIYSSVDGSIEILSGYFDSEAYLTSYSLFDLDKKPPIDLIYLFESEHHVWGQVSIFEKEGNRFTANSINLPVLNIPMMSEEWESLVIDGDNIFYQGISSDGIVMFRIQFENDILELIYESDTGTDK
jgi:hypothetical protein